MRLENSQNPSDWFLGIKFLTLYYKHNKIFYEEFNEHYPTHYRYLVRRDPYLVCIAAWCTSKQVQNNKGYYVYTMIEALKFLFRG